jgi:hypothetical protein
MSRIPVEATDMRYLALATDYDNTLAENGRSRAQPAQRWSGYAPPAGTQSLLRDADWTTCYEFASAT